MGNGRLGSSPVLSTGEMIETARGATGRRYWRRLGGLVVLAMLYVAVVGLSQSLLVAIVGGLLLLAIRHLGTENDVAFRLAFMSLLLTQIRNEQSSVIDRDASTRAGLE
jgi:hypothetical protein